MTVEQGQERYEVYCIACGNTLSLAVSDRERALVEAVGKAYDALEGGDGPPDTVTAQLWLRTTFPEDHPNYVDRAAIDQSGKEARS